MSYGTHYEVHVGVVTDNVDPEQRGRIRVRCDTLAGTDTELPDFVDPVFPYLAGDGQTTTAGWCFIPDVGVAVELEIATSSPRDETTGAISFDAPAIRWRACVFARGGDTVSPEFIQNYPNRRGIVTGAGHALIFDDTANDPEVKLSQANADGTSFLDFDERGNAMILTSLGMMFYMNQGDGELSIIDTNSNAFVMNADGWYVTSAASDMVKAGGGALSIFTGDMLINASGVNANVGAFQVAQFGLDTPVLVEGILGFSTFLANALTEISTALTGLGFPTTQTGTMIGALGAGAFSATLLSSE